MIKQLLIFSTLIFLFSCKNKTEAKQDILTLNVDNTVNPGDDFFMYANGGWIKRTAIPDAESGWGIGNMVQDDIYNKLKIINEDAAKNKTAEGTITQKIGSFWKTGMDTMSINKAGLQPLNNDFKNIDSISNSSSILVLAAQLQKKGVNCLFNFYVSQDDKNSEVMAVKMDQGGLGLPNRDYYFNTDERTLKVKAAYKKYLIATLSNIDSTYAVANAEAVFNLETNLAKSSRKLADLRDPYKNYNKLTIQQLNGIAPGVNWTNYASTIGFATKVDSVIVGQPEFFKTLSYEITHTPLAVWKNYFKLKLINSSAAFLDSNTFNKKFEYSKTLTGATKPKDRWKRVLDAEENAIGEALGQLFVKEYFSETAKKRYDDIVENIRVAYKDRIAALPWMTDSTKTKAYQKLSAISKKVGYPDKWKDFSTLKIDDGPWVLNVQRANEWWFNDMVNKLGKPVDRSIWEMTPQTYNAYYNPSNNEIVLPAGIFAVPGYKDEELDDALVYGYAAASTVGHEITHGFDDQGRQYDYKGNLQDWWTKSDGVAFSTKAQKIINQFNEFMPVDTLHINGSATQGENIADLGGLVLGIDAFKKTEAYKKNKKIGGFTQMQRYFLGYALGWLYTVRKERLANLVMTDVHSPAKERVNGPFANIPEFYAAFNIKKGDKMYREDSLRVKIW